MKYKGLFVFAILVLLLIPLIPTSRPSAASEVIYKVPITIFNNQSIATIAPFQQMLVVNSSAYSLFEAANLQNVEFYYQNGTTIRSWLESGNNSTADNAVYWLNLQQGIPADTRLDIYMGFTSISTSLFDNVTVGEAPTLSPTYGEFDNGANVFPFYTNFNGTSLPAGFSHTSPIPSGSTLAVSNGVKISGGANKHLVQLFYDTSYDPEVYAYDAAANFSGGGDLEYTSASSSGSNGLWLEGMGVFSSINTKNLSLTDGLTGQTQHSVANTTYPASGGYIISVWQTYNETFGAVNYNVYGGTKNFTAETTLFPELQNSLNDNFTANWIRMRALPPNGVMPSVVFGQVSLALTTSTASASATSSHSSLSSSTSSSVVQTSTSRSASSSTTKTSSYGNATPSPEGFSSSFIFFSEIVIGAAAGVAAGSVLILRRSRKSGPPPEVPKDLTPTQKAKIAQLDRLYKNGLITRAAHDSGIDRIRSG